jgi:hypothetical protein
MQDAATVEDTQDAATVEDMQDATIAEETPAHIDSNKRRCTAILPGIMRSDRVMSKHDVAAVYGIHEKTSARILREARRVREVENSTEEAVRDGLQQFHFIDAMRNTESVKTSLRWFHQQFVGHPCQALVKTAVDNAVLDLNESVGLPAMDAAQLRWRRGAGLVASYNEYMPFKSQMNTVVVIVYSASAVRDILQQNVTNDRVLFDKLSDVMVFPFGDEAFVVIMTSGPKIKSDMDTSTAVTQNIGAGRRPLQWYLAWGDLTSAFVFVNIPVDLAAQKGGCHGWSKYTPTASYVEESSLSGSGQIAGHVVDTRPPRGINDLSMTGLHVLDAAMFAVKTGGVSTTSTPSSQTYVYLIPEYEIDNTTQPCTQTMVWTEELETVFGQHVSSHEHSETDAVAAQELENARVETNARLEVEAVCETVADVDKQLEATVFRFVIAPARVEDPLWREFLVTHPMCR